MICFCTTQNDHNVVKIVIGPETQALTVLNGPISIDLDTIMNVIKSMPNKKNIIQISFCEDEEWIQDYINEHSEYVGPQKLSDGNERKLFPENNDTNKSSYKPPSASKKCPTCSGYGLIDSEGNVHQCESCMKIDAYQKGLRIGLERAAEENKKKKSNSSISSRKRSTSSRKKNSGDSKNGLQKD